VAQKNILVISDIHVGSSEGLCPPNFTNSLGNISELSPRQSFLWDNYIAILNGITEQNLPVDLIVANGDMIDGKQKKNEGAGLTILSGEDQVNAAIFALREIQSRFPNVPWRFVEGTPYHEQPEQVRLIARHFNAPIPKMTLRIAVGKANVQFHHEVGFSSSLIGAKAAALEKAIVENLIATTLQDWRDYHILVRSHVHYFRAVAMRNHICISTPCFQMQNRYGTKASPSRNIPDLGMLYLRVDDSLLDRGMTPVAYSELLFKYPEPEMDDIFDDNEATA
jgi:hypothetical protein